MNVLSMIVAIVMFAVALLHFYWSFGGRFGLESAGPKLESNKEFIPSGKLIFFVACLMLGLAVLPRQLINPIPALEPIISYIGFLISAVFILRGIGDFKYVGMFKKVYNSNFALLDTRYFSPLIIALGVAYGVLAKFAA